MQGSGFEELHDVSLAAMPCCPGPRNRLSYCKRRNPAQQQPASNKWHLFVPCLSFCGVYTIHCYFVFLQFIYPMECCIPGTDGYDRIQEFRVKGFRTLARCDSRRMLLVSKALPEAKAWRLRFTVSSRRRSLMANQVGGGWDRGRGAAQGL